MRVLAGDIGGTNARLTVFSVENDAFQAEAEEVFPSADYSSLEDIVSQFVSDHRVRFRTACFGVPGPVQNGRAEITNLPWVVEASRLARAAGVARVALINDLEAQAWGVTVLEPDDLTLINAGERDARGNAALIAAGTGLGQAGLYWDGVTHRPFACEGGHTSFAPADDVQVALLDFLRRRFPGHVSWERVVSGPGLVNLHEFLMEHRREELDRGHIERLRQDGPAEITRSAKERLCPLCVEALDLFVRCYAAEAANLALKLMALGGVYLGGGIAPRILEELTGSTFLSAFLAKGRMRPLLEAIPVRVIVRNGTALLGAARYAALLQSP